MSDPGRRDSLSKENGVYRMPGMSDSVLKTACGLIKTSQVVDTVELVGSQYLRLRN